MALILGRSRRLVPGAIVLALVVSLFFVARLPTTSAGGKEKLAERYRFTEMPIAMPPGYRPTQTVRKVNPAFYSVRAWVSAEGASIALNDLQGNGREDDLCLVDTRTDAVVVTHAPTAPQADRFTPFVLNPAPLPMGTGIAPMGCTPGDFNGDARMDLMVNYWGRTPILFLARSSAATPSAAAFQPVELVPQQSADGAYHGPRWNTNAVNVADFDGDGHPDILVTNYFPDSDVLDPNAPNNVQMNSSLSDAKNGGEAHVLRWFDATAGDKPSVRYVEAQGAIPYKKATGWTLAASSADLTGDGLPELYLANDFGKDHLFHNVSAPGKIKFDDVEGERGPTTPKSFVIGHDSFKGMGVDFGDLNGTGRFDMVVSNITTAWGIEESNFAWMNQAKSEAEMKRRLTAGKAPFKQKARELGMAFKGWGWDVKMGDFRNSGQLDVLMAEGFVKGEINRWPWVQELAMVNDSLLINPRMWPSIQPGDDVAGSQPVAFYARGSRSGAFADISGELGLAVPIPTRGIAMADTRGTGALDLAVARQWGPPAFYANNSPGLGKHLALNLFRPVKDTGDAAGKPGGTGKPGESGESGESGKTGMSGLGSPVYGAVARIRTADGRTQIAQLDGGGGHSGKRSFQVRFGLGAETGPVTVDLSWRDETGQQRRQTMRLAPGDHDLMLDTAARKVENR